MIPRILWLVYGYILVFLTGGTLLMTLFVAPALFLHLGVKKAGEAVGALFPGYFHLLFTGLLVEVLLLLLLSRLSRRPTKALLWTFSSGLLLSGILAFFLGPRASSLKTLHDALPADPALTAAFATAHRESFMANLLILIGLLGGTLSLLSRTIEPPQLDSSSQPSRKKGASESHD
ncbi:MAG: DUF4149 domain-containing protein [Leptospirales bacterium]